MATYDDPEMIRVGTFRNAEGNHDLAQKGSIFYHTTERKYRPGDDLRPAVMGDDASAPASTKTREGHVYREGNDVVYELVYGTVPSSDTMQSIAALLPGDMRKKKFIIRKAAGLTPAKL